MADKEQLRILDLGVKHWNKWRKENPDAPIDLNNARLATAELGGVNLSKASLSHIDLIEANLTGANFSEANLERASLERANLISADLTKANLTNATLSEANLLGASLSHADLTYANLDKAELSDAYLNLAILKEAFLCEAYLGSAEVFGANLSNADLAKADLEGAYLGSANFSKANLQGANLTGTFLHKAILKDAICTLASFAYSNLSFADISGAQIDSVNTSIWNIKGIKCTHVFRNDKRIDYSEGEFEKIFTQIHQIIELVIKAPFSDLTYYTGRIIQESFNDKYGEGSLVFKGQTALSNDNTKYEFISFQKKEEQSSIEKAVFEIRDKVNLLFEEFNAKQNDREFLKVPEKIPLGIIPLEIDTRAIQNFFADRFIKMNPILQKVIFAVQSTLK